MHSEVHSQQIKQKISLIKIMRVNKGIAGNVGAQLFETASL